MALPVRPPGRFGRPRRRPCPGQPVCFLPGPGPALAAGLPLRRRLGLLSLVILAALLVALPLLRRATGSMAVAVFDAMFRTGALVFGGGHVVLPLLQAEVVPPGWVTEEQFVAGYGAAQAVPGPLFTFAAYLGAVLAPPDSGPLGPLLWGLLALVAIFLPSFLLLAGALPFWDALRRWTHFQGALRGINAAVVGLLLAALYDPVWTSAIEGPRDVAFALAAFALLALWLGAPLGGGGPGRSPIGAAGAILVAP